MPFAHQKVNVRASALAKLNDCPRRVVHELFFPEDHQWRKGAGATVGRLTHRWVEARVKGEAALEVVEALYGEIEEEREKQPVEWDRSTGDAAEAMRQAKRMGEAVIESKAAMALLEGSIMERRISHPIESPLPGVEMNLTGKSDALKRESVADLKTGQGFAGGELQLAVYGMLAKYSVELPEFEAYPETLAIIHVRRLKKETPPPEIVRFTQPAALYASAHEAVQTIKGYVKTAHEDAHFQSIPANTASKFCSKTSCCLHGTENCPQTQFTTTTEE